MIKRAFFISENYLKDNSPLSSHVDVQELYPYMKAAEDMYIQEAIGTKLFNKLITGLNASPRNINDNEKELLFKIRDALTWYIPYYGITFLAGKIRNIGVVEQSGDNLKNVEQAFISRLEKRCKDTGDFYCRIMQKWLCENSDKFPEYRCGNWNCSELTPSRPVGNSCDLAFNKNDRDSGVDTDFVRKWLNNR